MHNDIEVRNSDRRMRRRFDKIDALCDELEAIITDTDTDVTGIIRIAALGIDDTEEMPPDVEVEEDVTDEDTL